MFREIYVDNYKCLQDFRLDFCGRHSLLVAGMNGSGKSAIFEVLMLLQAVGRGESKIANLIKFDSITAWSQKDRLVFRFTIQIGDFVYEYELILERPNNSFHFRVAKELLSMDNEMLYSRALTTVTIGKKEPFDIEENHIALPLIVVTGLDNPINRFKFWLTQMFLLRPMPHLMGEVNNNAPLFLTTNCDNFTQFFMEQMTYDYSLFTDLKKYVVTFIPDFMAMKSIMYASLTQRSLQVSFGGLRSDISFSQLSDGEKIFFLLGFILALSTRKKNMFVFWDEPDNYLARSEVQNFIRNLRSAFSKNGQIIITSHNEHAAMAFSSESSILLYRESHSSPTNIITIPDDADFPDVLSEIVED